MRLQQLQLYPFGLFTNQIIEFKAGLNVILGDNEAGKSTIFAALERILFVKTRLTPHAFANKMGRYLPLGGGDILRLRLAFIHQEQTFKLTRQWGANASSELILANKSALQDEAAILEQLMLMLRATPATYRNVLLIYQNTLQYTVEALKAEATASIAEFKDKMRSIIMETAGISVAKFKELLELRYKDFFDNWDSEHNRPNNNRDIGNPYRRNVGKILQEYYQVGNLKRDLKIVQDYENRYDELNQRLKKTIETGKQLRAFINTNRLAAQDAQQRQLIEGEIQSLQTWISYASRANAQWPVLQHELKRLEDALPELIGKKQNLEIEKAQTQEYENQRQLRELFIRVLQRKAVLDEAERNFQDRVVLPSSELEQMEALYHQIQKAQAKISAGRLQITFTPNQPITISAKADAKEPISQHCQADESYALQAGCKISIHTQQWILEAVSGASFSDNEQENKQENQLEEILAKLEKRQQEYDKFLNKHGLADLEAARQISKVYQEAKVARDIAERMLAEELMGHSYAQLAKQFGQQEKDSNFRKLSDVISDLLGTQNQIQSIEDQQKNIRLRLEELHQQYGDSDGLLIKLAKQTADKSARIAALGELAPLPEGFADCQQFLAEMDRQRKNLEHIEEQYRDLVIEQARLEREAPDASVEELTTQLSNAQKAFDRVRAKAQAMAKIRTLTQTMTSQSEQQIDQRLGQDIEKYLALLTSNKYVSLRIEQNLPSGIYRQDNELLPNALLSVGTATSLALALRLAMANVFLDEGQGFVVMDDPLVDMDPERQQNAFLLLQQFAKKHQVIIFTCHPQHANTLGGFTYRLG